MDCQGIEETILDQSQHIAKTKSKSWIEMKTFRFNTGVKIHNNPKGPNGGILDGNGVWYIPFDCDNVPDNAVFIHACNSENPLTENHIVREMHNTKLLSKYAHFRLPID